MSSEFWVHLAEIIILGLPLWFGFVKILVIFREYPPHLHERDGGIRYPRGMEPGKVQRPNG